MYSFVWFELWIIPSYFFFGKIKNFDCWKLDKSATFIIVTSKNMFFCMQIMLSNFKMRVFISCTPYPVPVLKKVKTRQIFGQFTVTAPLSVHAALKEKKKQTYRDIHSLFGGSIISTGVCRFSIVINRLSENKYRSQNRPIIIIV